MAVCVHRMFDIQAMLKRTEGVDGRETGDERRKQVQGEEDVHFGDDET